MGWRSKNTLLSQLPRKRMNGVQNPLTVVIFPKIKLLRVVCVYICLRLGKFGTKKWQPCSKDRKLARCINLIHLVTFCEAVSRMVCSWKQSCQIFLGTAYQHGGKYTKLPQKCQMAIQYVVQMVTKYTNIFQGPPKYTQNIPPKTPNWNFWS
jgi:hypothetical protein